MKREKLIPGTSHVRGSAVFRISSFLFRCLFPLIYGLVKHLCFGPFAGFPGFVDCLEGSQVDGSPPEEDLSDPDSSAVLINASDAGFTAGKGFPFSGFPAYAVGRRIESGGSGELFTA